MRRYRASSRGYARPPAVLLMHITSRRADGSEVLVQALSEKLLRVLAFMDQAERGGSAATYDAINAFAAEPEPPFPYGHFSMSQLGMVAPDVAGWFISVGLAFTEPFDDDVWLTSLGRAMVRGAVDIDPSTALLLSPGDELSYAQLVVHLSSDQPTLLADPYIRLEPLWRLLAETTVDRVLTSSKIKEDELRGMASLLLQADREVELRVSDEASWHDRYIVRGTELWQLGASMNGLHRNTTALLSITDESVRGSIREYVEALWQDAEAISAPAARDVTGEAELPDES